jgi:hypothetical protein
MDELNSGRVSKLMTPSLIALLLLTSITSNAQVSPPSAMPATDQSSLQPPLAKVKSKMADNSTRLPNNTCVQTIERSHRDTPKKRFQKQELAS